MPIKFRCEHCRQLLGISQTKAGEMVDCPTCGRAVRVPSLDGKSDPISIPKWDPQDQTLVRALNEMASFTGGATSETGAPAAAESAESSDVHSSVPHQSHKPSPAPIVTVIPESIEMAPLEEAPVVLPGPVQPAGPSLSQAIRSTESTQEGPWSKLAELSQAAPPSASQPSVQSRDSSSSAFHPGRGVTLPLALLLVAMAFLLGYFIGNARTISPSSADSSQAAREHTPENELETMIEPATSSLRSAVEGRVTYISDAGRSQSDTGAVVILLPAYRKSSTRLPIVGCRPADSSEDREIAKAMIEALGGAISVVDDRGFYSCNLPQAGEFHLIVLSRHLERDEAEAFTPSTRVMLGEYFDRPQQLVGQLKFHINEVTSRGEGTEIRDHTFGRES